MLKESIRSRAADGAAVIVSSHLLALIEDLCSRVLIIHRGRQRFCGTLAELKARYGRSPSEATLEQIFFLATADGSSRSIDCTVPSAY
jgi:ABC-2 type transport system ATP-binding protein